MIRKMHVNLQLSLIEPSSRRVIKTVRNRRCNSQGPIRLQKECFLFPTVAFNAVLSFSKLFGHIDLPNWKPRTHSLRHGLGFVCLHYNAITVKRFHRGFPFGSINVLLFKLDAQIKKEMNAFICWRWKLVSLCTRVGGKLCPKHAIGDTHLFQNFFCNRCKLKTIGKLPALKQLSFLGSTCFYPLLVSQVLEAKMALKRNS